MSIRIATLNLQQDHNRWEERKDLVCQQLAELRPTIFALNEVSVPRQTGRWLQQYAREHLGLSYSLVQQTKVNESSRLEAEAILARLPIVETGNLDYRSMDAIAQVVRLETKGRLIDIYVTHLYRSRGEDPLRHYQVQQLLEWIDSRSDVRHSVVCGDFNATLDMPSGQLMASVFRSSQTRPTAFTPLQEPGGQPSHPYWERLDRCIDHIWVSEGLCILDSGLCFDRPGADDPTLWPSDHLGVWADLEFVAD